MKIKKNSCKRAVQMSLFPDRLDSAYLIAQGSPRKAFYRIWIEKSGGRIVVMKESGAKGRVLDRRCWPMENEDEARKLFDRQLKSKTNSERKSPRIYRLVE